MEQTDILHLKQRKRVVNVFQSNDMLRAQISEMVKDSPYRFVLNSIQTLSSYQLMQLQKLLVSVNIVKNIRSRYADPKQLNAVKSFMEDVVKTNNRTIEEKKQRRLKFLNSFVARNQS